MYNALAEYYDRLMDVDYDAWTDYFLSFIGDRDDGADIACGTGEITLRLIARGKKAFGADISDAMLSRACAKAAQKGVRALFVKGDMNEFSAPHPLGFVTCACDGVNYVSNPYRVFKAVYASLKKRGVFVFDVSSEYKLRNIIGNNTFCYEDDELFYVWRNSLGARHVDMSLTFFRRDGDRYVKSSEEQRQYVHTETSLLAALQRAGFLAEVYGFPTHSRPGKHAERTVFVAEKV